MECESRDARRQLQTVLDEKGYPKNGKFLLGQVLIAEQESNKATLQE